MGFRLLPEMESDGLQAAADEARPDLSAADPDRITGDFRHESGQRCGSYMLSRATPARGSAPRRGLLSGKSMVALKPTSFVTQLPGLRLQCGRRYKVASRGTCRPQCEMGCDV
jgi:hypothetical protein